MPPEDFLPAGAPSSEGGFFREREGRRCELIVEEEEELLRLGAGGGARPGEFMANAKMKGGHGRIYAENLREDGYGV